VYLIWHVISRSGVVISITNCYIQLTYFTLLNVNKHNINYKIKHFSDMQVPQRSSHNLTYNVRISLKR